MSIFRLVRCTETPQAAESSTASEAAGSRANGRYTARTVYAPGDKVIVCVCEDTLGTWRPGVVADFNHYPVRVEKDRYCYPVLYTENERTVMGYFDPCRCEMLYDEVRSRMRT
ncbi:hypothetical protein C8Q80DRAFT_1134516 [Daedaleopsis nitida]|nr:hypothetical protein C8Q80DRAFT_1134516 [Daedaleopsis nitida]